MAKPLLKTPRGDAKLKRLDDALKDEILRRCLSPGVKQSDVLEWLANECCVVVSAATLSDFCSWWPARKRAMADEASCQAWMDHQAETGELTPEQIFQMGQAKFARLAISRDDSKTWAITTMATDSAERVKLEREKSEQRAELIRLKRIEVKIKREELEIKKLRVGELLLKAALDAKAQEIATSPISNEEKIRMLREHYFSDVDALENSGTVNIPA